MIKFKKIFLFSIFTISFIYPKTNLQFEIKNLFIGSQTIHAANVLMMNSFGDKKYGTFAWAYKNYSWSEIYGGLTYMPTTYFQIGFGLGLEDADDPLRLGSMIWVGKEDWYILSLFEDGGSGKWHQINAIYSLNQYLGIGLMKEQYTGFGPKFELTIPSFPIKLWFSLLKLDDNHNTYFTIKFLF
jgi:hypothetical protein|tara:strand:+ start:8096 stop:8650 length:555 start_codon:yes stop_codon:yes gene_type:complete